MSSTTSWHKPIAASNSTNLVGMPSWQPKIHIKSAFNNCYP